MAEQIIFDLEVNTGDSAQQVTTVKEDIEGVEDAIRNVRKEAREGIALEQFEKLNQIVDDSVLSIQELGAAVDNYKNIAIAAGTETPVGREALQRAAELERQLEDTQTAVSNLAQRGQNLQAALQISGTVIAGYSAFQSVTQLVGTENEELLESIAKVQAATSLLISLEEIRSALEAKSLVRQKALAAQQFLLAKGQQALAAIQGVWNAVTQGGISIQKVLNVVLAANPIGLIVTAIGLVIGAFVALGGTIEELIDFVLAPFIETWDAIASIFGFATSEERKAAEEAARIERERTKAVVEEFKKRDAAREASAKKQQEITDQLVADLDFEIRKRQAAGQDVADLEREKLEVLIANARKQIQIERDRINDLREVIKQELALRGISLEQAKATLEANDVLAAQFGQNIKDALAGSSEFLTETENNLKTLEQDLEIFNITQRKKRSDERKKAADDRQKDLDKQAKEEQDAADKAAQLALDRDKMLADLRVKAIDDETTRRLAALELQQEREREQLIEKFGEDTELLKELEGKQALEIADLVSSIEQKAADEAQKMREAETKREEEELQKRLEARISLAQSAIDITSTLADLAIKDEEKRAKAQAAITAAQMALNSAVAITEAVKAGAGQPFPLNLAAIAGGVAAVLTNIKTAVEAFKQARNVGSSGASVGSIPTSAGTASPGQFAPNPGETTFGEEDSPAQQDVRVVLVSDDVTNAQRMDERVQVAADF